MNCSVLSSLHCIQPRQLSWRYLLDVSWWAGWSWKQRHLPGRRVPKGCESSWCFFAITRSTKVDPHGSHISSWRCFRVAGEVSSHTVTKILYVTLIALLVRTSLNFDILHVEWCCAIYEYITRPHIFKLYYHHILIHIIDQQLTFSSKAVAT